MSNVIALSIVAVILLAMYTYMTNRLETLIKQEEERKYKVDKKRSGIEVAIFIIAYLVGSYLAMIGNFDLALYLSVTLIAWVLSFVFISKLTFKLLGKWLLTIVATLAMLGYYIVIYLTAK